jgi:malonyl-CoA O-methyltransferase
MLEQGREHLLEKQRIARSFSAAAKDYQLVDQLQQTVGDRLIERLELMKVKPGLVLDLGSGPGTSAAKLAKYYKKATIIESDISHSMLLQASKQSPRFFSRRRRLCSDAEMLGLKSASLDLVFSNLMLQWCNNLDLVLNETRRVLQPNALFIFSSFGPDTLMELRKSWQEVDQHIHVNAFVDMHDIGDALVRAGLENPVMETERITLNYENAFDLMRELKMLGAHNVNSGRRKTLTGKTRLQNMLAHYEKLRVEGKLPATYEVVYGHAWTPASMKARRIDEQTLAFPLSALKQPNK